MSAVLKAYARISAKGLLRASASAGKPLLAVTSWLQTGAGDAGEFGLPALKALYFTRKSWPRFGRMDELCKLGVGVAELCLGADFENLQRDDVALIGASMLGCLEVDAQYHDTLLKGGPATASPALFVYTLPSMFLGEIAIGLGLRGRTSLISQGRLGGVASLAGAVRLIETGRASAVLAVVAEAVGPASREVDMNQASGSGACAWLLTQAGEGLARLSDVRYGESDLQAVALEAGPENYALTYMDALQQALLGERSQSIRCGQGSDTISFEIKK